MQSDNSWALSYIGTSTDTNRKTGSVPAHWDCHTMGATEELIKTKQEGGQRKAQSRTMYVPKAKQPKLRASGLFLLCTDTRVPQISPALALEKRWHSAIMQDHWQKRSRDRCSYKFSNSWNGVWSKGCLGNRWCIAGGKNRSRHFKSNSSLASLSSCQKPAPGLPPRPHRLLDSSSC